MVHTSAMHERKLFVARAMWNLHCDDGTSDETERAQQCQDLHFGQHSVAHFRQQRSSVQKLGIKSANQMDQRRIRK